MDPQHWTGTARGARSVDRVTWWTARPLPETREDGPTGKRRAGLWAGEPMGTDAGSSVARELTGE